MKIRQKIEPRKGCGRVKKNMKYLKITCDLYEQVL